MKKNGVLVYAGSFFGLPLKSRRSILFGVKTRVMCNGGGVGAAWKMLREPLIIIIIIDVVVVVVDVVFVIYSARLTRLCPFRFSRLLFFLVGGWQYFSFSFFHFELDNLLFLLFLGSEDFPPTSRQLIIESGSALVKGRTSSIFKPLWCCWVGCNMFRVQSFGNWWPKR